jgi:hypothetical protein
MTIVILCIICCGLEVVDFLQKSIILILSNIASFQTLIVNIGKKRDINNNADCLPAFQNIIKSEYLL